MDAKEFEDECTEFLKEHHLLHTDELAAVYFNQKARDIMDIDLTDISFETAVGTYQMYQDLSRAHYKEALKKVKYLIDEPRPSEAK